MDKQFPFRVPVLLDEIYIFNHKSNNLSTAHAYVDVMRGTAYHDIHILDKNGKIVKAKVNLSSKVFRERKSQRRQRTGKTIEKITPFWLDDLQEKVNPSNPNHSFEWKRNRESVHVDVKMNPWDHSEIFIKIGEECSMIVKEKTKNNWIQAVLLGIGYAFLEDAIDTAVDGIMDELGIYFSIEIMISIDESGISIKVKIDAGGPSA